MSSLEIVVEQPAAARFKLWRPGLRDATARYFLAPNFWMGVQLASGMFVIALFRFVHPLVFPQSCVAATLFLVAMVMMAPDNHIGTRLTAAASLVGPGSFGAIFAGCLASLAKLAGQGTAAYTATLCVLGVAGLALLSINRVAPNPPFLWAHGMVSCLGFGIILITGRVLFPIEAFWRLSVGYFLLAACLAAGVAVLATLLVLPTLASDEVMANVTHVLKGAGHTTSNYAARLFVPPGAAPDQESTRKPHGYTNADASKTVEVTEGIIMVDEQADEAVVLEWLHQVTQPPPYPAKGDKGPGKVLPLGARTVAAEEPPISSLRPLLGRTRMLLNAARVEPPFLRSTPFDPNAWDGVVAAAERLITRISALESVLQDGVYINEAGPWNPEAIIMFRLTYAEIAAALQRLADAAGHPKAHQLFCMSPLLFGRDWEATKRKLAEAVINCMRGYWARMRARNMEQPVKMATSVELRSMMFTWSLTQNIVLATEALERAAVAAICGSAAAPVDSVAPAPAPAKAKAWLLHNFGWLLALCKLLLCLPMLHNLRSMLAQQLPAVLRSRKDFNGMLHGRMFQAGVKFWFVTSVMLVATVCIMANIEQAQRLNPFYGYIAAVLSMSEKVEATVSKVSFWLVGTAIGGGLGLLAMAFAPLATNPYGLMAILVCFSFAVGQLGQTQYRVTITLTLMAFCALVLCQYVGCLSGTCDVTGDVYYFLARVLSVYCGVLFAALVNNMVLPWYTSTWALDTMAATFKRSTALLRQFYTQFHDLGAAVNKQFKQAHPEMSEVIKRYEGASFSQDGKGSVPQNGKQVEGSAGATAAAAPAAEHPAPRAAEPAASLAPRMASPASPAAAAAPAGGAAPAGVADKQAEAAATAVPGLPPSVLQASIAAPLAGVQAILARDSVLWQRGVLATPKVVHMMLQSMLSLLDRMAAMQMTLAGAQVLGNHTGAMYDLYLAPLHAEWAAVYDTLEQLADCVAAHLHNPSPDNAAAIRKQIDEFEHQRVHLRSRHILARRNVTRIIAKAESSELPYLVSPSDSVAVMSFLFAHIKVLDAATVVARCVLEADCQQRNGIYSWVK